MPGSALKEREGVRAPFYAERISDAKESWRRFVSRVVPEGPGRGAVLSEMALAAREWERGVAARVNEGGRVSQDALCLTEGSFGGMLRGGLEARYLRGAQAELRKACGENACIFAEELAFRWGKGIESTLVPEQKTLRGMVSASREYPARRAADGESFW
jgi:hypothetical protein